LGGKEKKAFRLKKGMWKQKGWGTVLKRGKGCVGGKRPVTEAPDSGVCDRVDRTYLELTTREEIRSGREKLTRRESIRTC